MDTLTGDGRRTRGSTVDTADADVVAAVFASVAVSHQTAVLVMAWTGDGPQVSWANDAAVRLLGYAREDLCAVPVGELFPTLGEGALGLLLRRERTARMTLPVARASGVPTEALVSASPSPGGRLWTLRLVVPDDEEELAARLAAAAQARRFAALTERSPVPTFLSEQGMRLAHVNDAFCALTGVLAEHLLGTGWLDSVHPDDVEQVVGQAAQVLAGGDAEVQARLVSTDGTVRTAVLRFAHLDTPGVGVGFVGTVEDVTDRLAFETRLAHQATHDPLTGLPNRTLLGEYLDARFTGGESSLACLFLDLDDFKVVNDSLGHAAGDQLLVEVATRLRATVRPTDMVARFGGDEFVVVCEGVDEPTAVAQAGRIAAALARPLRLGGVELRLQASVGVTAQTAEHGEAEDLIRDCDIAMYQAKARGKGRITVVDRRARADARDKLRLVSDLTEAIEQRALSLAYQPVLDATDGRVVGVEALARWHHPERGDISPAVFVQLAETSGLIGRFGALVLDEACRQMGEWVRELGPAAPPRANVNVSVLQVDETLPGQVAAALQRHRLPADRIAVEITESALMKDPRSAQLVLQQLRRLGVQVAIDDFGTGYSSLAYLRRLPVDCLKVDRSFVAELTDGHREVTSAVVSLARNLGLQTVAEGVETADQARQLTDLGVTHLQGYWLARPMDPAATRQWLLATHAGSAPAGTAGRSS